MRTNYITLPRVLSAVLGLALIVAALPVLAAPNVASDKGDWIVMLEGDASTLPAQAAEQAVARAGGRVAAVYEHAVQGYAVHGASKRALERMPGVVVVEPDIEMHSFAQSIPTGVNRVDADVNTIANIDGIDEVIDVDVAVIDGGIDLDHPDLNVVSGVECFGSCVAGGDDPVTDGHGTHVAGTIGALDNDIGVVGVAPGARLWAVKVLSGGTGSLSDVILGVDYVTANASEIEVANMSLGGFGKSDTYQTAIRNSVNAGVVYVVAAGNDSIDVFGSDGAFGRRGDVIPAAYPEVATISALVDTDGKEGGMGADVTYSDGSLYANDDSFAPFSNYSTAVAPGNPVSSLGRAIDLIMPGMFINSTVPGGGYSNSYSGTSMASPHAAGLATLEIAQNGRAYDAAGVYAIRQTLIDQAKAQGSGFRLATNNDPDGNFEPLGYAGGASEPVNQAPTAGAVATPSEVPVGETVTFDGTGSSDPDGDVLNYDWTFSDGGTASGAIVTRTYAATGTYSATLTVSDAESSDSTSVAVTVVEDTIVTNEPPTAGFTFSATDLTVDFTDQSTDDGTIASWSWDFGDGKTSTAQNPIHTYTATGSYTVTLTVTDGAGATDTASQTVTVAEPVTSDITLSLSGNKDKGRHVVTVNWDGATGENVDIKRDGDLLTPTATPNDGTYEDRTGNRGGATYIYQVCEAGSTDVCSDTATISF